MKELSSISEIIKGEFYDSKYQFSYHFFERLVECLSEGAPFVLELQRQREDLAVWFVWRSWEKMGMDKDTVKWIIYDGEVVRNWEL